MGKIIQYYLVQCKDSPGRDRELWGEDSDGIWWAYEDVYRYNIPMEYGEDLKFKERGKGWSSYPNPLFLDKKHKKKYTVVPISENRFKIYMATG